MKPRLEIKFTPYQRRAFFLGRPFRVEENEFLLNHARSGILLALKSLRLPSGSKVGVMAYNCHTVFNAVTQAGYEPVFVDVNDSMTVDLDDLRSKQGTLSAFIITHLFGIWNDVVSIRQEYPNLPIIEDCAHAYGVNHCYGDFAVFSFGQGKLPSLGDGGLLRVLNSSYVERTRLLYSELADYTPIQSFKLFCRLMGKSLLYRPLLYSCITRPMKLNRSVSSGKGLIVPRKMSQGIASMLEAERRQILHSIVKRQETAMGLIRELDGRQGISEILCGGNAFMLVVRCENPATLATFFKAKGVETATHFAHCLDWASSFGYKTGMCPQTEYLVKHLLMIPTYN